MAKSDTPFEDEIGVSDEVETEVKAVDNQPVRKPYTVICESGLFKNGKDYPTGSTVELDDETAANFIAAGDVEAQ